MNAPVSADPALSSPTTLTPAGAPLAVLFAGVISTGVALAISYATTLAGWSVMNLYVDFIIPVGPVLVGLIASSGFGIASWTTGTKISGGLLAVTCLLLAAGYIGAQYLEFLLRFPNGARLDDGTPLSFFTYFDFITRSIAFEDNGKPGSELGLLGYGVRALDLIGFTGSGALIPIVLRSKPYCEACGIYMRTRDLGWLGAGPKSGMRLRKEAKDEAEQERQQLRAKADAAIDAVYAAAAKNDGALLQQELAQQGFGKGGYKINQLEARIALSLTHCRRCAAGILKTRLLTGQGKAIKTQQLREAKLDPGVVTQLTQRA